MVDIIRPTPRRSFGEELGGVLGSGIGQGIQKGVSSHFEQKFKREIQKEKEAHDLARLEKEYSLRGGLLEKEYGLKGEQAEFDAKKRQESIDKIRNNKQSVNEDQLLSQEELDQVIPYVEESLGIQFTPEQKSTITQQFQKVDQGKSQKQTAQSPLQNEINDLLRQADEYAAIGEKDLASSTLQTAKIKQKEYQSSPEFKAEQELTTHQVRNDVEYNKELQSGLKSHILKKRSISNLDQLNKKGVTGKPYEKLLEKAGLVNVTSEGRREFAADVKNLITDIRQILGAQFTGFEFQTILNAYPSADFSQEANQAIINNLKIFEDIKDKEYEVAERLKKENNGKIPYDYQSKVNKEVNDYANSKMSEIKYNTRKIMNEEYGIPLGNTLMFDTRGEPLNVPEDQIEKYLNLGAILP